MSNRDKKLLVYLLAVGIVAIAYFFIAKPFFDKQSAYEAEISTLQSQVNYYNGIYQDAENYQREIADAKAKYDEIADKFLAVLDQDNTLMILDGMEDSTGAWISRVSFQTQEALLPVNAQNAEGAVVEEQPADQGGQAAAVIELTGVKQDLNLEYSSSYDNFKKLIEYVQNYDQKLFITSINTSYEPDSNKVKGEIILSQYAITGTDKEYESPDLSSISTGTDNLFTTLKSGETLIDVKTLENPESGSDESVESADTDTSESNDSAEEVEKSEDKSENKDSAEGRRDADEESSEEDEGDDQSMEGDDAPPPEMEDSADDASGRRPLKRD